MNPNMPLTLVASRILDRALDCPTAFGGAGGQAGDKILLVDVHAAVGGLLQLDLAAFKQVILACFQVGLLTLSRLDMVELVDPAKVADSEIVYLGSAFHCISL